MRTADYDEVNPSPNKAYIVIKRNYRKKFYFTLVSPNGRTVCTSEGYQRLAGCIKGINALRRYSASAILKLDEELKDANFTIEGYNDSGEQDQTGI